MTFKATYIDTTKINRVQALRIASRIVNGSTLNIIEEYDSCGKTMVTDRLLSYDGHSYEEKKHLYTATSSDVRNTYTYCFSDVNNLVETLLDICNYYSNDKEEYERCYVTLFGDKIGELE